MNIVKKFLASAFLIVLACSASWGQDAVAKAVTAANNHVLVREYDKAYSYAAFLVRYYAGKEMPAEALDACERAVSGWADELRQKEDSERILALEQGLSAAPQSVKAKAADAISWAKRADEQKKLAEAERERQDEIQKSIELERKKEAERELARQRERKEFEEKEATLRAERERMAADQQKEIDKIISENRSLEERREKLRADERIASQNLQVELETQRMESDKKFRDEMTRMIELSNKSGEQAFRAVAQTSASVIVGLAILAFVVLAGVVIVVMMSLRQQAIQHEQFQSTIAAMTNLRNAQDLSLMALPFASQGMQALPGTSAGAGARMLEQKTGKDASSPPDGNSPEEIKALYEKCLTYAEQIDVATNRKNASKRVAELVYKISKSLGYSEQDSLLFYTVGLVYDIGFLNIDPVILRSEHISEEQFATIKTHTTIGTNMVFFIDEKNRNLFKDGVSMHHENLDGTGYPKGLKDAVIPYIARVLRIAETYTALVSSRNYKDIKDRDSAIRELYEHANHYDAEIVKILDNIV
ncbi:MAG TPA: HD domain-containing phosphohydrolase [Treponemataceae bacterium]|nr:HD domain-containing phosphohydrolase [Treponemataceae bacterium]